MSRYTIITPVLDDARALERLLDSLYRADARGTHIVVDGGSRDDSVAVAEARGCTVIRSEPGRAVQLANGIAAAEAGWLWMLHADTVVPRAAVETLASISGEGAPGWGRFDVTLADPRLALRVIGAMMNLRSRLTGICTGDQGIFVHTALLDVIGGMPNLPLMEDIELSKRLKRVARPRCPRIAIETSARRWRHHGVVRTVLLMWWLRLAYWVGVSPVRLARMYYGG